MSGPTAAVVLPAPLVPATRDLVVGALFARGWGSPNPHPLPFAMDWAFIDAGTPEWSSEGAWDETSTANFRQAIGWWPQSEVLLISGPNLPACHVELAEACLLVAELTEGLVNLGGVVQAPDLPGRKYAVAYATAAEATAEFWVVDTTWLRAWLEAPGFRMVK